MSQEFIVILTALAIYTAGTISPGPSFSLIVRLAASGARSTAFGATLGFSIGAATYATLAMTGFALIITQVGWLMTVIQIAGGCYLVYLGVSAWIGEPASINGGQVAASPRRSALRGLRIGLIVELSNPKSVAFFVSIFAVAVPPDTAIWVKATILVGGFLVDLLWYGLAATLLSMRPVRILYQNFSIWINRALGTVLTVFGLRIIYEKL